RRCRLGARRVCCAFAVAWPRSPPALRLAVAPPSFFVSATLRRPALTAMTQADIDVYSWPTPNGHKVHIMLEECRLPYRVHAVDIGQGELFAPDFLQISPNNKIPATTDPNGPGGKPISLFESGAILVYLAGKTGKLLPAGDRAR